MADVPTFGNWNRDLEAAKSQGLVELLFSDGARRHGEWHAEKPGICKAGWGVQIFDVDDDDNPKVTAGAVPIAWRSFQANRRICALARYAYPELAEQMLRINRDRYNNGPTE